MPERALSVMGSVTVWGGCLQAASETAGNLPVSMEEKVMNDVVRRRYHPLMVCMPGLLALGRAGRSTVRETLGKVAVRLAAAVVLTLASVAPAWAVDDSVPGPIMPRLYPGALPYQLDGGRFDGSLGRGDLRA